MDANSPTHTFKLPPFAHQQEWWDKTRDKMAWGIFWDQGTGKTKLGLDTAAYLFRESKIDAVFIVASGGVHTNWVTDEIPKHLPDDVMAQSYVHLWNTRTHLKVKEQASFKHALKHEGLAILSMTYSAFMTTAGKKAAWAFLKKRRVLYVLDESHNIKGANAKRTTSIVASGSHAPYRRIMTGTPVTAGPFDAWSQVRFLDPSFWLKKGFGSYAAFKTHFGVFEKGWNSQTEKEYDNLVGYKNLGELHEMLREISCRVMKDDVLDLPPKLYSKRQFELTDTQWRHYRQLEEEYMTELQSGGIIDAELAIVRMLRFQQITCGYLPGEDGKMEILPGGNPRLEAMEEIRDQTSHSAIVWARFQQDITMIMDLLGDKAVRYDGRVAPEAQVRARQAFQAGDVQWFVANPAAAGEGLTLHRGKSAVYYSNSFVLRHRLQSEDRTHRAGMDDNAVNYIDLMATGTIDEHLISNLRAKVEIANIINGDQLKEWI